MIRLSAITPEGVQEWLTESLKESNEYSPEKEKEVAYIILSGLFNDMQKIKDVTIDLLKKIRFMNEAGEVNQFFTAGTLLSALGDIASRGDAEILTQFKKLTECFPLLDKYKDL